MTHAERLRAVMAAIDGLDAETQLLAIPLIGAIAKRVEEMPTPIGYAQMTTGTTMPTPIGYAQTTTGTTTTGNWPPSVIWSTT